ncbi:hypothetical protein C8R45DRAFT_1100562 [Mycena sanguinolenta]|nr:hypothetical protein C8R45DRAFT_1100562 [Mycena sanguinolenta]
MAGNASRSSSTIVLHQRWDSSGLVDASMNRGIDYKACHLDALVEEHNLVTFSTNPRTAHEESTVDGCTDLLGLEQCEKVPYPVLSTNAHTVSAVKRTILAQSTAHGPLDSVRMGWRAGGALYVRTCWRAEDRASMRAGRFNFLGCWLALARAVRWWRGASPDSPSVQCYRGPLDCGSVSSPSPSLILRPSSFVPPSIPPFFRLLMPPQLTLPSTIRRRGPIEARAHLRDAGGPESIHFEIHPRLGLVTARRNMHGRGNERARWPSCSPLRSGQADAWSGDGDAVERRCGVVRAVLGSRAREATRRGAPGLSSQTPLFELQTQTDSLGCLHPLSSSSAVVKRLLWRLSLTPLPFYSSDCIGTGRVVMWPSLEEYLTSALAQRRIQTDG